MYYADVCMRGESTADLTKSGLFEVVKQWLSYHVVIYRPTAWWIALPTEDRSQPFTLKQISVSQHPTHSR